MIIQFHKTVAKQKLNDDTKQIVQTVTEVAILDDKIAKARYFLERQGIKDIKPLIAAPEKRANCG